MKNCPLWVFPAVVISITSLTVQCALGPHHTIVRAVLGMIGGGLVGFMGSRVRKQ